MLTFGSLFAGIGGMDLGLERAGMKCVWQVEIDHYARRVLEKNWPDVRRWDDVRTFPPTGEWGCDLICGGFPCQDISYAGLGAGIDGERSGLWSEYIRIVRVLRPRFVLVENVAALLKRGMGRVLGDLADSGFDAEWRVLQAAEVGAPHIRARVFLLAYPSGFRPKGERISGAGSGVFAGRSPSRSDNENVSADANNKASLSPARIHEERARGNDATRRITDDLRRQFGPWCGWECPESLLCRVDDGIPDVLDRDERLGNAVVPQIAEWIGNRIQEAVK